MNSIIFLCIFGAAVAADSQEAPNQEDQKISQRIQAIYYQPIPLVFEIPDNHIFIPDAVKFAPFSSYDDIKRQFEKLFNNPANFQSLQRFYQQFPLAHTLGQTFYTGSSGYPGAQYVGPYNSYNPYFNSVGAPHYPWTYPTTSYPNGLQGSSY